MKLPQVISIGEALIDRLGPPEGDPDLVHLMKDCFGGAPANVACALSRFGVKVAFIGSLGDDSFGRQFKNLMIERGINIDGLQTDNLRPTRIVLVKRNLDGDRSFGGFVGNKGSGFADQALSWEQINKNWPLLTEKTKWLIVGSIPLSSRNSSEAFSKCVENALSIGIDIAFDLNWRPTFWRNEISTESAPSQEEKNRINFLLDKVRLIKLAKEEAEWFFDSVNPAKISQSLPQRPSVIVTDGSNPVSWILNQNCGYSTAISPPLVVDTTGAGDAFTAGLIYKLLSLDLDKINQQESENIIKFAIGCGAHVCQFEGAIKSQPYIEDVEKLLS
tara:strand:- start:936 stop:1931 length:996 start_codon:yes stop_codon:yes gene_type:complete